MAEVLIVGAGVFGLTAALELRERGYAVTVLDPGPIPHPLGASNDLNKAVRMEYGADALYTEMVERSIDGWHTWNQRFGAEVYVETGVLLLAGEPMQEGGYEHESLRLGEGRGHRSVRLPQAQINERFAVWRTDAYPEALFNPRGGYARSALAVEKLAEHALSLGVALRPGCAANRLLHDGSRVVGVATEPGEELRADHTVLAAGVWTPRLLPELSPFVRATAHPMFYLRPADPTPFTPPNFCVFTADVSRTGWYGFPVDPDTSLLKVAKHDAGEEADPSADRNQVAPHRIDELREFLRTSLPGLADAPLERAKNCFYTDTLDGHFWIDRHPDLEGLTVATGGSGHAMKMAPVLGGLTADAVQGHEHLWLDRFRWRSAPSSAPGDAARAVDAAHGRG